NLGVFLAATLILPYLDPATAEDRAAMAPEQLRAVQAAELDAVMAPYVGMAFVLVAIWVGIALVRMPTPREAAEAAVAAAEPRPVAFGPTLGRLVRNAHYRWGVVAQFCNVAAQTCVWTFTIQYVQEAMGVDEAGAGTFLQYSLIVF
ncbi:hypothetical protein, partial [Staphylococcus aureus]|uniref:hypothetical protein n=1 Tax=Staphylococcus aureus TaxID=1280 RepID=UPI00211AF27D